MAQWLKLLMNLNYVERRVEWTELMPHACRLGEVGEARGRKWNITGSLGKAVVD